MKYVWLSNLQGPQSHLQSQRHWRHGSIAEYAKVMQEVDIGNFIISSDLGQYLNPVHTDGLKAFIPSLRQGGLHEEEIDIMCRRNPAALLRLK